jgi:hypothetical protein
MMENRKSMKKGYLIFLGIIVFVKIVSMFPMIRYNDKEIWMFAPERIGSFFPGDFAGKVLGDHVLETEYGEIRLGKFSTVLAGQAALVAIDEENFANGLASHNLVVERMIIPHNVRIAFNPITHRIENLLTQDENQDIIVSDISLNFERLDWGFPGYSAGILLAFIPPGYITLTDATQIYFAPSLATGKPYLRTLLMYINDGLWTVKGEMSVKLPGEDDFTAYETITFRPNWDEFIEGELFVEKDPEAERKKSEAMLKHLQDAALFRY